MRGEFEAGEFSRTDEGWITVGESQETFSHNPLRYCIPFPFR